MRGLWISTAAVALLATTPAFAQLGGSIGGRVGGAIGGATHGGSIGSASGVTGGVGAQGSVSPNTGGATSTVRGAAQGASGVVQGAASDAQGVAGSAQSAADGSVSVGANGSAGGAASNNGASGAASGYAGINVGMSLVSRTGQTYGQIIDIVRNRAGQVTSLTIQTADGLRRSIPTAGVSAQGKVAMTNYSSGQFNRLPKVAGASATTAMSSNVNANVGGSTTMLTDRAGNALGRVISVTRNASGRVTSAIVQTSDGVQRMMPGGQLSFEGNVATTAQSEAQLRRLRPAQ